MNLNDLQLLKSLAYVDGAWCGADGGATFPVTDPASGTLIAAVPDMGAAETRRAIEAADRAWPAWRNKTAKERAAILRKWFELMLANAADIARLMTTEQGKPYAEAMGEVLYAASFVEWFAEEAKRVYGDTIPATQADKRLIVVKQPIGVCAAITPWNFPAAMITRKVAPALAAGCTAVVKPAEQTPLTALALAELAHRAGFPAGVFNVVTGAAASAPKIGGELTGNPIVRKLSFTGSTEVGRVLLAQCAETIKKTSMELGGNAPFIVFDDADLDAAVQGAMASKYRNAGQTCVCANRILVQDSIYDTFVARLSQAVRELKVGDGFGEGGTVRVDGERHIPLGAGPDEFGEHPRVEAGRQTPGCRHPAGTQRQQRVHGCAQPVPLPRAHRGRVLVYLRQVPPGDGGDRDAGAGLLTAANSAQADPLLREPFGDEVARMPAEHCDRERIRPHRCGGSRRDERLPACVAMNRDGPVHPAGPEIVDDIGDVDGRAGGDEDEQPTPHLIPVKARPSITRRCSTTNRMRMGAIVSTLAAMSTG